MIVFNVDTKTKAMFTLPLLTAGLPWPHTTILLISNGTCVYQNGNIKYRFRFDFCQQCDAAEDANHDVLNIPACAFGSFVEAEVMFFSSPLFFFLTSKQLVSLTACEMSWDLVAWWSIYEEKNYFARIWIRVESDCFCPLHMNHCGETGRN